MNLFYSKLKKVSALSKEELFLYVFENRTDTVLKIVTHSGCTYTGCVINIGDTRDEGKNIVLQLKDKENNLVEHVLHIAINKIESVELINKKDILNVLSKGKITEGEQYEVSGKLEVKREIQQLSENILKTYHLNSGVPEIILPEDGFELNRILKLSRIIYQVISELLKEADALASWKMKYHNLIFTNADELEVKGVSAALHICFPFNDLDAPFIDPSELNRKLMGVL
jgi:hypothetical protein